MKESQTYADAGVDVEKASELVNVIKKIASQTSRKNVMGEIGGFGGLYALNAPNYEKPVLVSSTDGVGTKLKIAFMMDKHDTIGLDLVAMSVNDIAVQGAKPLFFLDYISMSHINSKTVTQILQGIAKGCQIAQCSLIGGETAEMPGFYNKDEYDLAGFAVGVVEDKKIIDGSDIRVGHKLIGISSSGLHSNGYSLVRKICFDILKLKVDSYVSDLGKTLGEELLTPTRIYVDIILSLMRDLPIHGLAHITGGGIIDNILRIIPHACQVVAFKNSWDIPPIFSFLQKAGKITDKEMLKTFNNGVGLIAVVPENAAQDVIERLNGMGEKSTIIGELAKRKKSSHRFKWC